MADTVTLNPGASGAVINTDDIGGTHTQIIKLGFGALDALTLVTTSAGLPVQQQGTFTVDLGATDNAVLDSIDAAVNGTLTVGSHAVTNAGTFATQVDGAALTALQLIDDSIFADDAAFTLASSKVTVAGAVRDDALSALTAIEGDAVPVRVDANGALWVIPSGAVAVTDNSGSLTVDNGGTFAVQVDAALPAGTNAIGKLAANSGVDIGDVDILSVIPGTGATNLGKAEDAAHTSGDTGVMALSVRQATATALSGTAGDYQPLITDGSGRLYTVNSNVPQTSGGLTIFRSLDIDETEEAVKATPGQVYHISAFNTTAAPLYLKFYNATVATVSVGTTTPVLTFLVPGNADSDGAGFVMDIPTGIEFGTAITVACTTGVADNDTGAPGANACLVNVLYS